MGLSFFGGAISVADGQRDIDAARDDVAAGTVGRELDGGDKKKRGIRADIKPITGTRLIREWQDVKHVVTVTADGFEWQGRPYKSILAIACAITGTRWNGWVFFGPKSRRARA